MLTKTIFQGLLEQKIKTSAPKTYKKALVQLNMPKNTKLELLVSTELQINIVKLTVPGFFHPEYLTLNNQGFVDYKLAFFISPSRTMSSTLIEVVGHIVFSFTRGVTEHFNPEEPEFTAESFGYDPLQSTGREWNYLPVDELIYQEYSDGEVTSWDFPVLNSLNIRVINACSTEENEEINKDQQDEDRAMAWKRLRPSALLTVCKSMYIGALISLLSATIIGSVYIMISYLCSKTINNCQFDPKESIPVKVQWLRSISDAICVAFLYPSSFVVMLFLFRPFQLMGAKRKLILVCCFGYSLDVLYRVILQALGISHSKLTTLQKIPLNVFIVVSICCQLYLLTKHLCKRLSKKRQVAFFFKMTVPAFSIVILAIPVAEIIYPVYNKQSKDGKLLIALFAPLIGVVLKVVSRICVQRLWNITHPGYSYTLLSPLYCTAAVMFRVLQADLDSLQSIVILGIIHGATEVIERSTMVAIDHIFHVIWKRTSAPWGSFRTPRRERLMADIAIMSMLFESTAIVSVNGFLYLYQFIYLQTDSLLKLLQSFAITTSVQLAIEWFFTSMSLAIETHYQNMAVMAVWQKRWKRHISLAILSAVLVALWTSTFLLIIVHGRFNESLYQPCKMPFT